MRSDPAAHGPFQPKLTEVWIPSSKVSVHPQICSFESGTDGDVGRKSSNHHRQKIGVIIPCRWLDFPKCKSHIALCISAQTVLCTQSNRNRVFLISLQRLQTSFWKKEIMTECDLKIEVSVLFSSVLCNSQRNAMPCSAMPCAVALEHLSLYTFTKGFSAYYV